MSDSTETVTEDIKLKAGHPPAVKVAGGVRITQSKLPHEKPVPREEGDEENEEIITTPAPMICSISGAPIRGNEDFPSSSVKAFHEKKTIPKNEFRPKQQNSHAIHQPRK